MKRIGKGNFMVMSLICLLIITPVAIIGIKDTYRSTLSPNVDNKLTIVSRHDIAILNQFRDAFLKSSYGAAAGFSEGDTSSVEFLTLSSLTAWEKAFTSDSIGADLGWGGGPTLFNQLADIGLFADITDPDMLAVVADAVPSTIGGSEMTRSIDGKLVWVANAISSFGFTVNTDKLTEFSLEKPLSWEDLTSPDFFIAEQIPSIAMGNAPETTSNTRIYQIILQKFGWDKGWEMIKRMAGNGGIFGGSVATRAAVIQGQVPVSLTIDFYGVFAQTENPKTEYVIPDNGSIINGDPISFGAKADNIDGAKAFFEFVNSDEGQALWVRNDRLPINVNAFNTTLGKTRPDVKQLYDDTLANQGIEFDEPKAQSTYFTTVDYFESSITNALTSLKAVWADLAEKLIKGEITQAEFDANVTALTLPEPSLAEAIADNEKLRTDTAFRTQQKETWTTNAKAHYNSFLESDESETESSPPPFLWVMISFISMVITIPILRRYKQR
ncbi:MAG: ABC transporter substrate-binding protein [Candidatus Kariarchaeaceae archaeon]